MSDGWHVCYEGGEIDLGYSRLAAGLLSADDRLPSRIEREWIADDLLNEVLRDEALVKNIWGHAGTLALVAGHQELLTIFLQDWP